MSGKRNAKKILKVCTWTILALMSIGAYMGYDYIFKELNTFIINENIDKNQIKAVYNYIFITTIVLASFMSLMINFAKEKLNFKSFIKGGLMSIFAIVLSVGYIIYGQVQTGLYKIIIFILPYTILVIRLGVKFYKFLQDGYMKRLLSNK